MAGIAIEYGSVQVFDDALPAEMYAELVRVAPRLGWHFGWRAQLPAARYWHHEISGGQKSNTVDVSENVRGHRLPVFANYVDWLRSTVVPEDSRLLRLYLNGHTFGTDGSPHTDTHRPDELTMVLFLNPGWKLEYGGETVVFDAAGEIEHAVIPRENRLLTFPSNRLHAPRPLSKLFLGLRMVLVAKFGAAEREGPLFVRGSGLAPQSAPQQLEHAPTG